MTVEIIIVDNGSSDHTASVVEECSKTLAPTLRYLCEPRRGASHARNTGIAEAEGEMLLFTDDDTRLPQQWISLMCKPIIEGTAHAVAGDVIIAPHLERPWMQPVHRSYLAVHQGKSGEPAILTGANMGFSRQVLSRVPSFDTELGAGLLGYYEESLFSLQLSQAGYKVVEVPEAVVEHHFQADRLRRTAFLEAAKGIGRSQAYVQHHWEHRSQPHLSFHRLRKEVQLAAKRCLEPHRHEDEEGADPWEIAAVSYLHMLKQFAIERKRPHNYTEHGLVKQF